LKSEAIIYVPSDTPESMVTSTIKIAGVPLIVRGIMTLFSAGIKNVTLLIAESQKEKILKFLGRFRKERLPQIKILSYDEPYRVSPKTIEEILRTSDEKFILINGNLIFDNNLIKNLNSTNIQGNETLICHEGSQQIPIVKTSKKVLEKLILFTTIQPRSIESCLTSLLKDSSLKIVRKSNTSYTFLVRRPQERIVAEKFLAEAIRLSTNGPVAKYINKRISLPISLFLSRLWISPHAITAINIVIGLLSGVFIAGKGYVFMLIGASLFQIASVADGVDGEISKLTFRASKFGQFIDTISDNLALASCLIGLTISACRTFNPIISFSAGILAIINTSFVIWLMVRYLKKHTNSASLATFNKVYLTNLPKETNPIFVWFLNNFKYFAMKDCFAFLIFALGVIGVLPVFLFFTTFGTMLAALSIGYLQLSSKHSHKANAESKTQQNLAIGNLWQKR